NIRSSASVSPESLKMPRLPHPRNTQTPPSPLPDRSLEPDAVLPTVVIRAGGLHPFIYQKMVVGPVGDVPAIPGDLVRIADKELNTVGFGLFNPRSRITLRVLT